MFDSSIIGCYEPDEVKLKFKELEMRIVIMNPKADIQPDDIRNVRQRPASPEPRSVKLSQKTRLRVGMERAEPG